MRDNEIAGKVYPKVFQRFFSREAKDLSVTQRADKEN